MRVENEKEKEKESEREMERRNLIRSVVNWKVELTLTWFGGEW